MTNVTNIILAIIFYIFPFIIIFNFKKIDPVLRQIVKGLKTPDILVPYLAVSVVGMGSLLFSFPYSLYLLVLLSILGICLTSYIYFMTSEIFFWRTLRIWWRIVFTVLIFGHTIFGIYFLYLMW